MTTNYPLVVGVFQQEADAKSALKALEDAGFAKDQIGLALREGGIVTHSLLRDLVKLGVPEDRATYYDSEYKAGHPIISVRADGREQEAMSVLQQYGAYDQGAQGSTFAQTGTGAAGTYQARNDQATDDKRSLRLREEQLNVEKQRVQSGEVRLHKDVVEEQRSVDVPVTHEEVYVQQRTINDGRVSDTPIGQDESIRVPVSQEQVNVTKTQVETGEVVVGKRAVQENQRVTDTVRHEEARLEKDGNPRIRTDEDLNP